mmetsp:Transcript_38631/g.82148  ORF Transcript_38631/g.82148 Transcript_38631/m.82148 type:complete len:144 (-) Transcript_38631:664-1095(-)
MHYSRTSFLQRRGQQCCEQKRRQVIDLHGKIMPIHCFAAAFFGGSVVHKNVKGAHLPCYTGCKHSNRVKRLKLKRPCFNPTLLLFTSTPKQPQLSQLRFDLVKVTFLGSMASNDNASPRVGEHGCQFQAKSAASAGDHSVHVG